MRKSFEGFDIRPRVVDGENVVRIDDMTGGTIILPAESLPFIAAVLLDIWAIGTCDCGDSDCDCDCGCDCGCDCDDCEDDDEGPAFA